MQPMSRYLISEQKKESKTNANIKMSETKIVNESEIVYEVIGKQKHHLTL